MAYSLRYGVEGLIQFSVLALLGWISFIDLQSAGRVVIYFPYSLFFVAWLIIISVIAGGWPLAPPLGHSKRGTRRLYLGLAMTSLWLALSVLSAIVVHAFLEGPQLITYGILLLWVALTWGINLGSWPMRHYLPRTAFVIGSVTTYAIATVLALLLRNVETGYLTGLMIHAVAWSFVFSPPFIFQGYVLRRFYRQPRVGVASLLIVLPLAFIGWDFLTLREGLIPANLSYVAMSSMALWSLTYSWGFGFAGISKYRQLKRGLMAFFIVIAISALWTALAISIMEPLTALYFNLAVMPTAIIVHNIFWLRAPLSPPLLPGMPPTYQTDIEILRKWSLQIVD